MLFYRKIYICTVAIMQQAYYQANVFFNIVNL